LSTADDRYTRIALLQNSVIFWIATGLGSAIGIIELSDSNLKYRWLLFEVLLIIIIISIDRMLSVMNDIYRNRSYTPDPSFPQPSRETRLAEGIDYVIIYLNEHFNIKIIIYVLIFIIAQLFWPSSYVYNFIG